MYPRLDVALLEQVMGLASIEDTGGSADKVHMSDRFLLKCQTKMETPRFDSAVVSWPRVCSRTETTPDRTWHLSDKLGTPMLSWSCVAGMGMLEDPGLTIRVERKQPHKKPTS